MSAETDWGDPCAALAALRPAYYALVSGRQVQTLTHNGKTVTYARADIPRLANEIARLESACAAQTSGAAARPRRFAITAG